jgi:hypothetical protein
LQESGHHQAGVLVIIDVENASFRPFHRDRRIKQPPKADKQLREPFGLWKAELFY